LAIPLFNSVGHLRYYGAGPACQAQSIAFEHLSLPGCLDTHPLVPYIRLAKDRKLNYPQITQITPIKKG
jgi:hypothetical protein